MLAALLDLVLPVDCAGCARAGQPWCTSCAKAFGPLRPVRTRADVAVSCWALGDYAGPLRQALLAMKEHRRRDWVAPAGVALASGLRAMAGDGLLPASPAPVLVPAPTRAAAARVRGGDPVTRFAAVAARQLPGCAVTPVLSVRRGVRDSVGLSARSRQANVAGQIIAGQTAVCGGRPAVLVDDVITTGATAAEAVRALLAAGVNVTAVLAIMAA